MNRENYIDWTPFDLSGLAGSEKFHTAMLSWILSGECDGLKDGTHNRMLSKLTGRNIDGDIICIPESSPFDLLIKSDKFLIVVENKLSSTTYNDQIQKYTDCILPDVENESKQKYDKELQRFKGKREPIGILLSLANEKLTSISGEMTWKAVTYSKILEMLLNETNNTDVILQAYLRTLENLCKLLNEFLKNHTVFPSVFVNNNLKKTAKPVASNDYEKYITRNNLETGFQIALLRRILNLVKAELQVEDSDKLRAFVGETRGVGQLEIPLMDVIEGDEFLGFRFEDDFSLGFQYQGDILKVKFSKAEYRNSKLSDFNDDETQRKNFFDEFKNTYSKILKYRCRLNKRSKAYISVSLNIDPSKASYNKEKLPKRLRNKSILRESSIDDFVSLIVEECRRISEIGKRETNGDVDS